MKFVIRFYSIFVIIFRLAIEIDSCSEIGSDIIINGDDEIENDPCYIKRKSEHDANLEDMMRNDPTEKLNKTKKSYRESIPKPYQELSIRGQAFIILLLCVAFYAVKTCFQSCAKNTDIDNGGTVIAITSAENQTDANANANLTTLQVQDINQYQRLRESSGYQSATNISLLSTGINRRSSLPSYDDAINMPEVVIHNH